MPSVKRDYDIAIVSRTEVLFYMIGLLQGEKINIELAR
jgi:hypothetical protein